MDGYNEKDIYSTSEVKTNKVWIDGKPIYRKVVSLTVSIRGDNSIAHNIANLDTVVLATGVGINNNVRYILPYCSYSDTDYDVSIRTTATDIIVNYGGQVCALETKITIEYTKTTD